MLEMEDGATRLGFLKKIFPVMVRYITPALILVVEIGGIVDKIAGGQWYVVFAAYLLLAVAAASYFIWFKNTDTGTNADELALSEKE